MNNNFAELKKQIEKFQTDFTNLSNLQKLLLDYIEAIKLQKDVVTKTFEQALIELKANSENTKGYFIEALEGQLTRIDSEIKEQYKNLDTILNNFIDKLDSKLILQIDDLNKTNEAHRTSLVDTKKEFELARKEYIAIFDKYKKEWDEYLSNSKDDFASRIEKNSNEIIKSYASIELNINDINSRLVQYLGELQTIQESYRIGIADLINDLYKRMENLISNAQEKKRKSLSIKFFLLFAVSIINFILLIVLIIAK